MNDISTFVDTFCDIYDKSGYCREEGQKLPSSTILNRVCEVLLNVSCRREEGRYPSFRVCFIDPDSEFLDAYIYTHVLLFKKPINFNAKELHKLAPALNGDMSYLILDTGHKPIKMTGIIASYTAWEKLMTKESSSGARLPRIPNIRVNDPGELEACFGETSVVSYRSGDCISFRMDTFTNTLISDALKAGSSVADDERLMFIYRVLWHASGYGHGGQLYMVPSYDACKEYISIKYPIPSRFPFNNEGNLSDFSDKIREKEIIAYADLIAKFTSVDGAVVLTKDLELIGFGIETHVNKANNEHPSMCFIGYDGNEDTTKHFNDNGMRHRACYDFCDAVDGSVGIVISQDGTIKACTKHAGKVVVYDNVALPIL